ncbi:MAG: hypothetical protein N2235_26280, partial [Fischerella sp.]|nr:hypothetical protein [Fischerella sp.]
KFLETIFAYLENYVKQSGEDIQKIIVTGPQLDHGHLMFPGKQDFLGFQKIPYQEGEQMESVVINSALFPTRIFQKVLFDEKLVYGCDEIDLTTRAVKQGFQIKLCPEAVNIHLPSLINRDFYKPYHEASRIYVTFKRYLSTEQKAFKACFYLVIASLHTTAHSFKLAGIQGIVKTIQTLHLVLSYLSLEYSRK